MLNILSITFRIGRFADGRYHASCDELGVHTAAATLPELEDKLKLLTSAVLAEVASATIRKPEMIVSRFLPARTLSRTLC